MTTPSPTQKKGIDWPAVLGPLLVSEHDHQNVVKPAELSTLEAATFAHVRRAIRPRPSLTLEHLPFTTEPIAWFPPGRFLCDSSLNAPVRPGAFLHYAAGDYYIQDAGSMLALALCNVQPGEWVCDTCAAPGGKSSGLLEALRGQGILLANEVIRSRLAMLNLTLVRCGHTNHLTTNLEVEELSRLCGRAFDCVLVDAPCTGQTMVARGKQSMAAFGPSQIAHSSARQQRILRAAAYLVKPGGRMVYSTCAYSYEENERIVQGFLAQHPGWRTSVVERLNEWCSPVAEGCYRVWPHRHECSGAFAALLVNHDEAMESSSSADSPAQARNRKASQRAWEQLAEPPQSLHWLPDLEGVQWWRNRDQLHLFDARLPTEWIEAAAISGTDIADIQPTGASRARLDMWTPSFGGSQLAINADFSSSAPVPTACTRTIELDDAQAIRYVAGETVGSDCQENSWCLVTWRGRKLSWGKLTQGKLKNHFPKALRQKAVL
jgi:16S rRNA C967 or C1407 C5-methylase (RsmB/RsmF family)